MSKKKYLASPYLVWGVAFIIIPLLMVIYYGFSTKEFAFTVDNVASIGSPVHLKAL